MARRRGVARTRGNVCGDFGGRTDDGRPCQRPSSTGRCKAHRQRGSQARGSAAEVLQRRRKVERYLIRRYSPSEIQALLKVDGDDVSLRTVFRDLEALRSQRGKRLAYVKELREAVGEMLALYRERQRELWQLFHARGTSDAVQASCIRQLREEDAQILAVLQSLGQLPKEADRLRVESWEDELRKLTSQRGSMPIESADDGDAAEVVH